VSFDSVVGQKRPKSILQGALEGATLASAYLFGGPRGVGKLALALEVAKAVNCQEMTALPCDRCSACRRIGQLTYPDVTLIFPAPKKIKPEDLQESLRQRAANPYHTPRFKENDAIHIETIRKIETEANYKPYEGKRKVFILADAERMLICPCPANECSSLTFISLPCLWLWHQLRSVRTIGCPIPPPNAPSIIPQMYPLRIRHSSSLQPVRMYSRFRLDMCLFHRLGPQPQDNRVVGGARWGTTEPIILQTACARHTCGSERDVVRWGQAIVAGARAWLERAE